MPPLVSIIMPCYNAAAHLPGSVGSILVQTLADWELIVIDDGSTDTSVGWLRAQTDSRIHVLSQANKGVSAARNAGLSLARGQYLAFLDADDAWNPTFLEKMATVLQARPEAVMAYCGWQKVHPGGKHDIPFIPPDHETADKAITLFAGCRWPIHATLVRREAVLAVGGFDEHLSNAEDYLLWLKIAIAAPIVRVPEALAFYRLHGLSQASANKARAALHHLAAQHSYLRDNPGFLATLGEKKARKIMLGELLSKGYSCYWKRDITAARSIFREVMKQGYGTLNDWRYMLPALLPESWHRFLIRQREKKMH